MMVVWRQFAVGLLVCSPGILTSPGFAGSGDDGVHAHRLMLAQTDAAPTAGEAAEPEGAAVSEETAAIEDTAVAVEASAESEATDEPEGGDR